MSGDLMLLPEGPVLDRKVYDFGISCLPAGLPASLDRKARDFGIPGVSSADFADFKRRARA